ncbi:MULTISPECIES: acyltransferase family protein [unclassified Bradyrhizobium]|uniref:acyltransferase family protein n=1 Tax=unclassified Bradyrhizobium TaxID=2631580 RepID=UPI00143D4A21|nr:MULTISPECIES: acyltransferase family protein [unclassified Bradyrhizobium]
MLKAFLDRFGRAGRVSAATLGGITYRPEIDGLRAVAVVSVLFFHAHLRFAGIEPFKGGYLGVDIFFVISGYLIAGIIFSDLDGESFSLARFYERRARRILPALLLVIAASAIVGLLFMTPEPISQFARSIFAVIFFVANIFFYQRDNYFSEPSDLTPLLHTWSLSVEEQFYVFFPLLMILMWRFARRSLALVLIAGAAVSFSLALHTDKTDPSAAFYLLQNRAWEILTGSVLARIEQARARPTFDAIARMLPALGLGLIFASICLLGAQETSVGWNTVLAVSGTALIIRFGEGGDLVSRLLATRPLVGLGLFSYSLYLWHQPVFAFTRLFLIDAPGNFISCVLILTCLVLAYLSWRFVEVPFRNRTTVTRRKLVVAVIGISAALLVLAGSSEFTGGFPQRFSADQLALLALKPQRGTAIADGRDCRRQSIDDACVIGRPHTAPTFAVLGDSHAETLTGPLNDLFYELSIAAYVYAYPACPFVAGVETVGKKAPCLEFQENVFAALRQHRITSVIINDRSTAYISGTTFDNGEGGIEPGPLAAIRPVGFTGSEAERMSRSAEALRATLLRVLEMGITVYYILPVPEVGWHVPRTLVKLIAQNRLPLTTSLQRYLERNRVVLGIARDIQDETGFVPIYPQRVFCRTDTARCYTHDGATIFYTDTDHLSREGAEKLVAVIAPEIKFRLHAP